MTTKIPTVIYIGDPMCSWCWGLVPQLERLQQYALKEELGFEIKVGGLRSGSGDPWDQKMKDFLRHHWQQVHQASGQPFNYELLKREQFVYDTEPACRLVVSARQWLGDGNIAWFAALQERFYVDSKDLADLQNIAPLCKKFQLDFTALEEAFHAEEIKQATQNDFQETRAWGVHGYPTLVLKHQGQLWGIANGFTTFENIRSRLQEYLFRNSSV